MAAIALLTLAGPARALEVSVEVGLDGKVVDEGWTPVLVRCSLGPEDPPLDGRVVLDRPHDVVAAYAAPLRIDAGGRGTARLVVPVVVGAPWSVRVEDHAGRTVAVAHAEAPAPIDPDERLVVLAGSTGLSALGLKPADRVRVARLASADLVPREPEVLHGVGALFLRAGVADPALVDLARDPAAVATLEAWVRAGGVLVVTGGADPFWRGAPLDALLPARCDGEREAEDQEALALVVGRAPPAGPVDVRAPVPVLVAVPRPGAIVEDEGARGPLVIRRDLGRGRVVLVTFDPDAPSLRGADQMGTFLVSLTACAPVRPSVRPDDLGPVARDLAEAAPALGPGWFYGLTLATLAQLVAIAALAGPVSRRRGPLAGLLVAPGVSLLVTGLILLAGRAGRGEPRALVLVVSVEDGPTSRSLVDVVLVAGEREAFSLELPPGLRPAPVAPDTLDVTRLRTTPPTLLADALGRARVGPLVVAAHASARLTFAGAGLDLPAGPRLEARVVGEPAVLGAGAATATWPRLELRSRDARPLDDLQAVAFRLSGGRTGALAPLGPGAAQVLDLTGAASLDLPQVAPGVGLGEAAGLAALRRGVVAALNLAWFRGVAGSTHPSDPPPFPGAWVVHLDRPTSAPLVVRREDGAPVGRVDVVRVTCVAVRP